MKTILLENDEWFREGEEEWIRSFDPDYMRINTDPTSKLDQERTDQFMIGILCQPDLERIIAISSFEQTIGYDKIREVDIWQIAHYMKLIYVALGVRQKLGLSGLTIELCYQCDDFVDDVNRGKWGDTFRNSLRHIIEQQTGYLTINVYSDFKLDRTLFPGMITSGN